ncbi:MAG: MerR family transcriptional regulator [Paracoccaceae bacterium]
MGNMRIGELARRLDISTDTIRFYERRGLISAARRANGYRDYSAEAEALLRLIRLAQRLGFTLAEIGALTASLQDQSLSRDAVAAILREKLAEIEARTADLQALGDVLRARLADVCPLGLGHMR